MSLSKSQNNNRLSGIQIATASVHVCVHRANLARRMGVLAFIGRAQ